MKPNDLRVGDTVIVKSDNTSNALTPYQPNPMTLIKKKGSMITATHKGNQTTRNSSFFKKIPKATTNPTHNLLDYSSTEDESYTHTTKPPEPKDNQAQHTTLNLRRSGRTKRPPKIFDLKQKKKQQQKKQLHTRTQLSESLLFSFLSFRLTDVSSYIKSEPSVQASQSLHRLNELPPQIIIITTVIVVIIIKKKLFRDG